MILKIYPPSLKLWRTSEKKMDDWRSKTNYCRSVAKVVALDAHFVKFFGEDHVAGQVNGFVRVRVEIVEFFVDRVLFEVSNVLPVFGSDTFALRDVVAVEEMLTKERCTPLVG